MGARTHSFPVGMAMTSEDARATRYRVEEQKLWDHYGIQPTERFIELESFPARLRILEVGSGDPLLFVPGTAGTGPVWGSLLSHLEGFRCLLLDRPGWGFSSPIDYTADEYRKVVSAVMGDVLDALALERTSVVGASIGNVWAMRAAQSRPDRVDRVVLMGGGPLLPEIAPPGIIRLIASPIGALMVRLPEKPKRVASILRSNGHGPSLDSGRIPEEYLVWRASLGTETSSMRHERDMVRSLLAGKEWRPGLTFSREELKGLEHPVLMFYGTADPVASSAVWEQFVDLLPAGELELVTNAGHVPWLDDAAGVATRLSRFLRA